MSVTDLEKIMEHQTLDDDITHSLEEEIPKADTVLQQFITAACDPDTYVASSGQAEQGWTVVSKYKFIDQKIG